MIKTVVVLVMENRSFDHMVGWMKQLNPSINGVDGTEFNLLNTSDPNSGKVFFDDKSEYVDPDPGHSIQAIYEQVYGVKFSPESSATTRRRAATMSGFAQQAESEQKGMSATVMNGFRPDAVPVYKKLVSEFAVCDRWFASVPSSTQPNRLYVHSATSHGLTSNVKEKLLEGLPQKTIFDSLHESGYSFGIYYQDPPSTLFYRNLRKLKYITKFHPFDLDFKKHCRQGKLPNYTVVEQRFFDLKIAPGNDDHPSHDVSQGQKLVKEVYEALRSSPQWNEVLFIITYDEHGGFYDHVPTPTNVPNPDGINGPAPFNFEFDRLGVRVPTILVSPWIQPGTVLHGPNGPYPTSEYEHSSIPATVKKIFKLGDFLTKRDEWAGTFEHLLLTRSTPRTDCPLTLPSPTKLRDTEAKEDGMLSELQAELVHLGASLNGDCRNFKDMMYPDVWVKSMTVAEGSMYIKDALKTFLEECERCRSNGMDESEVVVVVNPYTTATKKKSFLHNIIRACTVCRTNRITE